MQFCAQCLAARSETPCPLCGSEDTPWVKIDAENQPVENSRCDIAFSDGNQRPDWRFRNGVFEAPANEHDYQDAPLSKVIAFRVHVPGAPSRPYLSIPKKTLIDRRGQAIGQVKKVR